MNRIEPITTPGGCGRSTAAARLREARNVKGSAALEAVSWARCFRPDSVPAIRLEAKLLIECGDPHAADALIARGLLLRPRDAGLRLLRVERMLETGRPAAAAEAIADLISDRPFRSDVHITAGRIERTRGNLHSAINHLERAARLRPDRAAVALRLLTEILLQQGDADRAAATLEQLGRDPRLEAHLLAARRRWLDAADHLENALRGTDGDGAGDADSSRDEILTTLLEILDRIGDRARLQSVLDRLTTDTPRALLRALESWLAIGDFERAAADAGRLLGSHPRYEEQSRIVQAIARTMLGDLEQAEDALRQLFAASSTMPRARTAQLWRRAILARSIRQRIYGDVPTPTSHHSALLNLLTSASAALEAHSRADDQPTARHRDLCRLILGREQAAVPVASEAACCLGSGPDS